MIFTSQAGEKSIEVKFEDETVWLTQKMLAKLFEVSIPTINEHLKNIFSSGELSESSVIRNFLITASDGKKYNTNFYNLDAIISYETEDYTYLLFYYPNKVTETGEVIFHTELVKINTDSKRGEKVFKQAVKILQMKEPPKPNKECGFCKLRGNLNG